MGGSAGAPVCGGHGADAGRPGPDRDRVAAPGLRRRSATVVAVLGLYGGLAVAVWWHVWSSHPASVSACGCGDAGLMTWFLAWPAYALAHGTNPFFSAFMFHPDGINLLANTSSLTFGVVLAPVTWIFGPVAALNVSLTAAPALSAGAAFWLVRRWTTWTPAAFTAGLVYGFSPFAIGNLAVAHLMMAALMVPPLVIICLEELLLRRRHGPVRIGAALGALLVVQFFLGTELLAIEVISSVFGLVLLVGFGLVGRRPRPAYRLRRAVTGLGTALVVSVAALAYPAWFALAGPAHISGRIWAGENTANESIRAGNFFSNGSVGRLADALIQASGYAGRPLPSSAFVGIGALIVIVAGLCWWRRDRRLWFFGLLGALTVSLSFGVDRGLPWSPWHVFARLPVVDNVAPGRFVTVVLLCVAVMVGLVVDHVHTAVDRRLRTRHVPAVHRSLIAALGAVAAAAVAVVPMVDAEAGVLPLATSSLDVPPWFRTVARTIPADQVVVAFLPPAPGDYGRILTWQAVDTMSFVTAEGAGPESSHILPIPDSAGIFQFTVAPPTTGSVTAMRQALGHYGVTTIVVLGVLAPTRWSSDMVALLTDVTGRTPRLRSQALVWQGPGTFDSPLAPDAGALARCAAHPAEGSAFLVAEADCLASPGTTRAAPGRR